MVYINPARLPGLKPENTLGQNITEHKKIGGYPFIVGQFSEGTVAVEHIHNHKGNRVADKSARVQAYHKVAHMRRIVPCNYFSRLKCIMGEFLLRFFVKFRYFARNSL